ncbi:MAG: MCE family protein [Myxococcales bacterium]|nr:MCE family protein [Myxococcales bacterium]MCB9753877.1 MCE family protein [Myxococcales bacterium]
MDKKFFSLGLFVVVSLGLLVAVAFKIGAFTNKRVDRYTVEINNAAGLVEGNSIKSAGVEIGHVGGVGLSEDGRMALLELNIFTGTPIYDDASVSVQPISLLGEKFVNIEQHFKPDATVLAPGSKLPEGVKSVDVANLFDLARNVVYSEDDLYPEVVQLTKRMNALVGALEAEDDEQLKKRLSTLGDKIESVMSNVEKLSGVGSQILEQNQEGMNKIVESGSALLADPRIPRIIGRVDSITTTLDTRLPRLFNKADAIAEKAERLIDTVDPNDIDRIVNDAGAVASNIRKMTEDLKPVTRRLDPIAHNIEIITGRATKITGKVLRKFLQVEGVKVNFTAPRGELKRSLQREGLID